MITTVRGPDMVRGAGDGFTVTARYVPTLDVPACAIVAVQLAGRTIEAVTVPAVQGIDVYRHPAIYLPAFRAALKGEPCLPS
jgi:hypothetical protein